MPISQCRHCDKAYWRWRPDHPPKGFCSVLCRELCKAGATPDREETPEVAIWRIRQHLLAYHDDTNMTTWHNCDTCEELEEKYAAALEWHAMRRV